MSSRHYTNSTETLVSDVVLSSVAGDETNESSVSVTSESSESVTSESVASGSVTAVSDISDLYTTSEVVSTSDSKIIPSTSVPSSEQRSSIPIMSSSNESSESRESSIGTILSEEQ